MGAEGREGVLARQDCCAVVQREAGEGGGGVGVRGGKLWWLCVIIVKCGLSRSDGFRASLVLRHSFSWIVARVVEVLIGVGV